MTEDERALLLFLAEAIQEFDKKRLEQQGNYEKLDTMIRRVANPQTPE